MHSSTISYLEIARPGAAQVVLLTGNRVTIGRRAGNGVVLSYDFQVSSLHAVVQAADGGWVIRDLGSTNGTAVNGERLSGERALRDGDTIRVGGTRITHRTGVLITEEPMAVACRAPARSDHDVLLAAVAA